MGLKGDKYGTIREETRRVCYRCRWNIDHTTGRRVRPTMTRGGKKVNFSECRDCDEHVPVPAVDANGIVVLPAALCPGR